MKQTSLAPTNKVVAGGVAGAVTVIVVWAVKQWGHVEMPPEIAVAVSTVVSFLAGWFTPPAERDTIQ